MPRSTEATGADRRAVLKAAALGLFAFQVAGCEKLLSPGAARKAGAALKVLSPEDAARLEAFGEVLVPGAREAGLAHFVDVQLGRPHAESLLTARYLDVLPPHDEFYRNGLAALDAAAHAMHGKVFAGLDEAQSAQVVAPMLANGLKDWKGPPQPLFYLAVRSDAADLVYGTKAAFDRMKVPYLAHIEPPEAW
ncbi:MAG: gluconate 2-dehydrogenase subunit 3 family protein [Novosphingobium sp.]